MDALLLELGITALATVAVYLAGWFFGRRCSVDSCGARVLVAREWVFGLGLCLVTVAPLGLVAKLLFDPFRDADDNSAFGLIAGAVTVYGWVIVLAAWCSQIELTAEGLRQTSWFTTPKFFPWHEVAGVEPGFHLDYVVRYTSGRKISIGNASLTGGFEWFVRACRDHLPHECYPREFRSAEYD